MSLTAAGLAAALAVSPAVQAAQAPAGEASRPVAALRGLDKFSGLTTDMTAVIGAPVDYARLSVTVRACVERNGEATAFLEIVDAKDGSLAFSGWMYANDPAVSALDHPRYDVWVLSCRTASADAS